MTDLAPLRAESLRLIELCRAAELKVATAESCTGGLLAAAVTELSGASHVFDWGVVTYSNHAKTNLLGVPRELIEQHGAVSSEVAAAMVNGALARSGANIAVAITGVAGPGGGTKEKPVGLVHIAASRLGRPPLEATHHFAGFDRGATRFAAVQHAIRMLMEQAAS